MKSKYEVHHFTNMLDPSSVIHFVDPCSGIEESLNRVQRLEEPENRQEIHLMASRSKAHMIDLR